MEFNHIVAKNIVCHQAAQARHMYRNLIPHYESEGNGQGRLGNNGSSNGIHQEKREISTYPEVQRYKHIEMVDLWIIHSTS